MPSFEKHITPPPHRQCIISVSITKYQARPRDGQQIPIDRSHTWPALIDTGATHTAISKDIAEELQLVPQGKILINSVTDKQVSVLQYQVNLHIPIHSIEIGGEKTIENISVANL